MDSAREQPFSPSNEADSCTSSYPDQQGFPLFSHLPSEIQLDIWDLAADTAASTSRLVRLELKDRSEGYESARVLGGPGILMRTSLESPLFNVCAASRSTMLKHYPQHQALRKMSLSRNFNPSSATPRSVLEEENCRFRYNPDIDMLYFSDLHEFLEFTPFYSMTPPSSPPMLYHPSSYANIRKLAIGGTLQHVQGIFGIPEPVDNLGFQITLDFPRHMSLEDALQYFHGLEELILVRPEWATWKALQEVGRARMIAQSPENPEWHAGRADPDPQNEDFLYKLRMMLTRRPEYQRRVIAERGHPLGPSSSWWENPDIKVVTEEEFMERFPEVR